MHAQEIEEALCTWLNAHEKGICVVVANQHGIGKTTLCKAAIEKTGLQRVLVDCVDASQKTAADALRLASKVPIDPWTGKRKVVLVEDLERLNALSADLSEEFLKCTIPIVATCVGNAFLAKLPSKPTVLHFEGELLNAPVICQTSQRDITEGGGDNALAAHRIFAGTSIISSSADPEVVRDIILENQWMFSHDLATLATTAEFASSYDVMESAAECMIKEEWVAAGDVLRDVTWETLMLSASSNGTKDVDATEFEKGIKWSKELAHVGRLRAWKATAVGRVHQVTDASLLRTVGKNHPFDRASTLALKNITIRVGKTKGKRKRH